jgi:PmbA protein
MGHAGGGMKDELFRLGEGVVVSLLKLGADDVIVTPAHRNTLMVRFSNNKVTVIQDWNVRGVDALAFFGRKRVISRLEDVSGKSVEAWVAKIVRQAKAIPDVREIAGMPDANSFPDHITAEKIDAERIGQGVASAIDSALEAGAQRVSGVFVASISYDALVGSNGSKGYDERPLFELNVRAFGGEASGQGVSCGTRMSVIHPEVAGRDAGEIAELSRNTVKWQEGKHDVLFGPIIGANLLERVGDACSAFNVEAGISSFSGRLGERVFSESMNVTDDGASDESPDARLFDDEGTPTGRNRLIENGILRSYLHNSSTAKRFKTSSTGNAGWISPSPWSLVAGTGSSNPAQMMDELGDGVHLVSNWYTRFQNYSTGDFSTISRDGAFLVKNGEVVGAIKGARVSDNLIRLFSAVDCVGAESKWIKWWEVRTPVKMPALISRNVNLTKAQGS